jgi:hypothetical protein
MATEKRRGAPKRQQKKPSSATKQKAMRKQMVRTTDQPSEVEKATSA